MYKWGEVVIKGKRLDEQLMKYALMGGTILGGGGGGSSEWGLSSGNVALEYGELELVDIEDVEDDMLIITASAVGAPAAVDKYVKPKDYVRTIEILQENTGLKVGGIITNENGGAATVNGWIQSAVLNIPLIDAPCNGRAHPTGTMGSMGLHNIPDYVSVQAIAGGNPEMGNYMEAFFKGNITKVSALVRQSAVQAGGLVAVARNPVTAKYVRENGALNGISHAIEIGESFYRGFETSPKDAITNVVETLKGDIVTEGQVMDLDLVTKGGFDVGKVKIKDYELTFWNEYMTLEKGKDRIGTFPDLIMTFDKDTGLPLTTAEIKKGQNVVVIATNKENIKLGSAMYDEELLKEIEPVVSREILKYVL